MEDEIYKVLKYFSNFEYPPTLQEIHEFISVPITELILQRRVNRMIENNKIAVRRIEKSNRYTIVGYSRYYNKYLDRTMHSQIKINKVKLYLWITSLFKVTKFVGISGSVAMMNALKNDDIDLFIITERKRLWTGRIISVIVAETIGLRRKRNQKNVKNKVCLNLFFDETNLIVPKQKRNEYVAHEILQVKPYVNKDNIYERFIDGNKWVFDIFPNALDIFRYSNKRRSRVFLKKLSIFNIVGDMIEKVLAKIQIFIIKKHQTTELITSTQLWFHPDDFERKIEL